MTTSHLEVQLLTSIHRCNLMTIYYVVDFCIKLYFTPFSHRSRQNQQIFNSYDCDTQLSTTCIQSFHTRFSIAGALDLAFLYSFPIRSCKVHLDRPLPTSRIHSDKICFVYSGYLLLYSSSLYVQTNKVFNFLTLSQELLPLNALLSLCSAICHSSHTSHLHCINYFIFVCRTY